MYDYLDKNFKNITRVDQLKNNMRKIKQTLYAHNTPILLLLNEPRQAICVFEHSVMTNFNCACPVIQRV